MSITSRDFGRPPKADENAATIELRLADVATGTAPRETLTVELRGQAVHCDVIQMPVGDLYYNPGTHRVKAQRSHRPDLDAVLNATPWSGEAQQYVEFLLTRLPSDPLKIDASYTDLKDSLREYGQNQPGLITRDGVLVNGNTRAVALKELHGLTHNMRVAILPKSVDWDDVSSIELALQLRKDHLREYSYVNRLLAVEELTALGESEGVIAAKFHSVPKKIAEDRWVLTCVRSMIERSGADGNPPLSLVSFEDKAEKLRELYRKYSKDSARRHEDAEVVKEMRQAAIVLGFSKTDVRFIEADFYSRYLEPRLPDELRPAVQEQGTVQIPGLSTSVPGPTSPVLTARAFTDRVLTGLTAPETDEAAIRRMIATREAMDEAVDAAGRDARLRKRKRAAPDRVLDAAKSLREAVTDVVMARSTRQGLDEEGFDDALNELRNTLMDTVHNARRYVDNPGSGLEWWMEVLEGKEKYRDSNR